MRVADGTYRERWVDEVFRTPLITDAVRVALLALAQDMDDEGIVSARRDVLAGRLGRSDRRIGDRLKFAIESGYLERVSRGQKNGTGRYQATIPGPTSSRHPGVPKNTDLLGTPGGPEDESLQDGSQVEEIERLEDTRGSSRASQGADVFGTPGCPQEPVPPYKDQARAHSNADRSDPTADVAGHGGEAVVIDLFGKEDPSLRSQKQTPARKRASESPTEDPLFAEFWKVYPRHKVRSAALKSWDKAVKGGADPEVIILGARRYATDPRRVASDIQYTAHASTWLNQRRWEDEVESPPADTGAEGVNGIQGYGIGADTSKPTDRKIRI
jgi:hypothetical protein